jgi:multiple antibiotic resistance protein
MTVWNAAVLLFLVLDPFGNIPFFVSALKHVPPHRHNRVVARELLVALGVLVVFLFAGPGILKALGISGPSLTVGGGVILFLIALRMVLPTSVHREKMPEEEPFIVPLAIPYVAGPSALASVLFITSREPARWPEWLLAVLLAWGASAIILAAASRLRHLIGDRGLVALERLMGMVLVAAAVQMILTGILQFKAVL